MRHRNSCLPHLLWAKDVAGVRDPDALVQELGTRNHHAIDIR
jgi:hypothetical protein